MAYVFGGSKYGRGVAAAMGLAACSLLGGCISTDSVSSTLGLNSPYEQVKGKFKTTAEARLTEKPRRTKAARSGTVLSFSGEPHHLTAMQAGEDLGLIRHARAEAYMRRILNKLAAQWPYEAPKVGVFVRASNSFAASSTESDILVPIVVFETVESEDQLAAILAHELSHILLNHHAQIEQKRSVTKAAATAGSMGAALAYASEINVKSSGGAIQVSVQNQKAAEDKAIYAIAAQMAIQTLVNDVAGPGWSRKHESEADLLAIDLLEQAGYDGRAMIEVLRKLGAEEKRREKKLDDFSTKYGPMIAQAASSGSMFGVMKSVAVGVGSTALTAVGEQLRRDHPDPEVRRSDVQGYLNREYADALHEELKASHAAEWAAIRPARELYRPVFEANEMLIDDVDAAKGKIDRVLAGPLHSNAAARWVAYQIYLKKGDRAGAYRHLTTIRDWRNAPIKAYAALAQHYAMVGRVSEGEIVLKRAQVNFQSEEVVLPSRISMYRAAGRTKDMEAQLALCQKSSDGDIRKSCQDATQSAKDQAVVAKREDGASTFLNDGSATFLNAIGSRIGM